MRESSQSYAEIPIAPEVVAGMAKQIEAIKHKNGLP
jgi:hypothetical protein